jgi:hypothetical protein
MIFRIVCGYLAADEIAPEQDRKTVKKRFAAFGD